MADLAAPMSASVTEVTDPALDTITLIHRTDSRLHTRFLAVVDDLAYHRRNQEQRIADRAVLQLNIRTTATRTAILDAIRWIVVAECDASQSPKDPESCSSGFR